MFLLPRFGDPVSANRGNLSITICARAFEKPNFVNLGSPSTDVVDTAVINEYMGAGGVTVLHELFHLVEPGNQIYHWPSTHPLELTEIHRNNRPTAPYPPGRPHRSGQRLWEPELAPLDFERHSKGLRVCAKRVPRTCKAAFRLEECRQLRRLRLVCAIPNSRLRWSVPGVHCQKGGAAVSASP